MGRRLVSACLAVLAAASLLAGCGGSGDRLTIYSGRTENLVRPLLERFSEESGIGIDVKYGDSADLALLIDEEGSRSPADVFLSQSPGALGYLTAQGRLRPLDPAVLGLVDATAENRSGHWVGVSGRLRVLVYNTDLVPAADLPRSVLDLTQPRYAGQVAVAPTNGSFQDFVTALRLLTGDDATLAWLRGLKANGVRAYANNNAIVEAVGRGEVPMGLVNHYYNYRAKAEDPDLPTANHVFPDGDVGALLIVSAVGVLETADDGDAAARFVRFLLSEEAQEYLRDETFEYPLAAGVVPAPGLPPLDGITRPEVDLDRLGGGLTRTQQLIGESGLEGG